MPVGIARWAVVLAGCGAGQGAWPWPVAPPPDGPDEDRPGEHETVSYGAQGAACVQIREGTTQILVDFGDCLSCSTNIDLWCDGALVDVDLQVDAGGTLQIEDCTGSGTCEGVAVQCEGPSLAPGDYTLTYAGVTVPWEAEEGGDWVCTGPANTR